MNCKKCNTKQLKSNYTGDYACRNLDCEELGKAKCVGCDRLITDNNNDFKPFCTQRCGYSHACMLHTLEENGNIEIIFHGDKK